MSWYTDALFFYHFDFTYVYIYIQSHTTHTCCMSTHDENRNSWQTNIIPAAKAWLQFLYRLQRPVHINNLILFISENETTNQFSEHTKLESIPYKYMHSYVWQLTRFKTWSVRMGTGYFSYMLKLFHMNYNKLASYSDFSCSWLLLIKSYSEALWFMNTNNCDVWKWANWILLLLNLKHMHWKESLIAILSITPIQMVKF